MDPVITATMEITIPSHQRGDAVFNNRIRSILSNSRPMPESYNNEVTGLEVEYGIDTEDMKEREKNEEVVWLRNIALIIIDGGGQFGYSGSVSKSTIRILAIINTSVERTEPELARLKKLEVELESVGPVEKNGAWKFATA